MSADPNGASTGAITDIRRARVQHRCDTGSSYPLPCTGTISPGELYRRMVLFPGADGNERGSWSRYDPNTGWWVAAPDHPIVGAECATCAENYGRPITAEVSRDR